MRLYSSKDFWLDKKSLFWNSLCFIKNLVVEWCQLHWGRPDFWITVFLNHQQVTEVAKKAEEERAKKRKSKSKNESSSAKKLKKEKTGEKGKDNKKQLTLSPLKKKVQKTPTKPADGEVEVITCSDSESDEDKPLAALNKSSPAKKVTEKKEKKKQRVPKVKKVSLQKKKKTW